MKRPIAAIIMTSYVAACASWRVQDAAPQKAADAGKSALALIGLGVLIGLVVAVSNIQTTDPNH